METAQDERAELHLAAAAVCECAARRADGPDGQDLPWPPARHQEPEGIAGDHQATALETPAGGHRRSPRGMGARRCPGVAARLIRNGPPTITPAEARTRRY